MNLAQRIGQEFKTLRTDELAPLITEVSGKATAADLADVAFSGQYTDLIGAPTVPTKVSDLTNDADYQTASEVNTAIQNVIGAAPAALDTLAEIASALNGDASFASTITTMVNDKLDASEFTTGNIVSMLNGATTFSLDLGGL